MFGVDIGHNRHRRGQTVEGAVGLVRLHHHPFGIAHARVGPVSVDNPAIDHRRVNPAPVQQRRHHRGRRGLAMRPRHGNVGFQAHQFRKHLGTPHHRQAGKPRRVQFRIARFDGRGNHHDLRPVQILRPLPDKHFRAQLLQPLGNFARLQIRTLHRVPVAQQHLGNAGHADTTDPDKMDRAKLVRKAGLSVHISFLFLPASPQGSPVLSSPAACPAQGPPAPWRPPLPRRTESPLYAPRGSRA